MLTQKERKNLMTAYNYDSVGIAGDWHSDLDWALNSLHTFKEANISVILHLGDFGIWPGANGAIYIRKLSARLIKNAQVLLVTLGNHEDYVRTAQAQPITEGEFAGWLQFAPNILIAPRPHRWEWLGRSFVSLGGANSIDREWRTEGISWWPEEQISMGDVYRTIDGGYADIMIAHDAPLDVAIPFNHRDGENNWTTYGLNYAKESRMMMQAAVDGVRPKMFFHGHYHLSYDKFVTLGDFATDDVYTTNFIGMGMNQQKNNLGVLTLDNMDFRLLKIQKRN
jgi:Calcineurin-like phosphoesterase